MATWFFLRPEAALWLQGGTVTLLRILRLTRSDPSKDFLSDEFSVGFELHLKFLHSPPSYDRITPTWGGASHPFAMFYWGHLGAGSIHYPKGVTLGNLGVWPAHVPLSSGLVFRTVVHGVCSAFPLRCPRRFSTALGLQLSQKGRRACSPEGPSI